MQLPLPRLTATWTTLAIDLHVALRAATAAPFEALRGVQLCAKMSARGLFTSDIKFGPKVSPPSSLIRKQSGPPCCAQAQRASQRACIRTPDRGQGRSSRRPVQSLPLEMVMSHALEEGATDFLWLPEEPQGLPEPDLVR